MDTQLAWTIERTGDTLNCDVHLPAGKDAWLLFQTDVHTDHPCSRMDMVRRHRDLAVARGAMIVDGGDLYDAMQSRYDKRRGDGDKLPELSTDAYVDALVAHQLEQLAPYAAHYVMLAPGNHETHIRKHLESDLTARTVAGLRAAGSQCVLGEYRTYIRLRFASDDGHAAQRLIYHHHGSGGSAPVTHGVIQSQRRSTYLVDADLVLAGHTHKTWLMPQVRERLGADGVRRRHIQWHVQSPGYKDVTFQRGHGWEIEKDFAPTAIGAWWLRWYWTDSGELAQDIMFAE